jgi:hypothetical protein
VAARIADAVFGTKWRTMAKLSPRIVNGSRIFARPTFSVNGQELADGKQGCVGSAMLWCRDCWTALRLESNMAVHLLLPTISG